MNSFHSSTQNTNWIKTKKELQGITNSKIEKIFKRFNDVNKLIKQENEEKVMKNKIMNKENSQENFQKYISIKNFFLSVETEKLLLINYSNKLIQNLNSQPEQSTSLKNNTLTYFRRFFLKKSILDYNANLLMAGAFRLASKVASLNFSQNDYIKIFPFLANSWVKLNEYEFYLCYILDYEFYVYNPYQALLGLIYTLEQKGFFLTQDKENYINQDDLKSECMKIIDKMYLTDIIFLYTYSEIALASLFIQCEFKNININNIAEYLDLDKLLNYKDFMNNQVEDMKKLLEEIPKYETEKDENIKIKEIEKNIRNFLENFPQYKNKLKDERKKLKMKMEDFENTFIPFEKKLNPKNQKK